MLLTKDLYEDLLVKPQKENSNLNSLLVFSGYATAAMASYYLEDLEKREVSDIKIDLILGMTPRDGLRESDHKGFVSLMNEFSGKFSCSYMMNDQSPVHSKLYVWCQDEIPRMAFVGSANYTQTALLSKQGEVMADCDPQSGFDYFNSFDSKTIYCNNDEVEDFIKLSRSAEKSGDETEFDFVNVSFLTGKQQVGDISGLNWGQRSGRNPNQAYIPLRAPVYRTDFFPGIGKHFTVLTDDKKILICSRAQQRGKAIHTPLNNSQMGEYFRNRLGVPNGAKVTREHLEKYGRTDVKFLKIDEENYYMDFSQNQ